MAVPGWGVQAPGGVQRSELRWKYRSLHCLPTLPGILSAIRDQFRGPFSFTSCSRIASWSGCQVCVLSLRSSR